MKFISEYRDRSLLQKLSQQLSKVSVKPITIMEVCGSHTMSIHRFGIPQFLPPTISLVSGPGCPVCVTSIDYIDKAVALARIPNTIITTYGDLIRVPGSSSTLEKEKANGADVRIIYSIDEALQLALQYPNKEVVFLAIGFEITTPPTAAGILKAEKFRINNFSILCAHKVMPPAMKAIIDEGILIDGFLAPGHVSVITGASIYHFIAEKFKRGVVISGFEPVDILQSILMLVNQIQNHNPKVEIQYTRVVKPNGNEKALAMIQEVFEYTTANWRGLGPLECSALKLNNKYLKYEAETKFGIVPEITKEAKGCICGLVLKGIKKPNDCKLFSNMCTPENPVGACMVSSEGACNVYHKFR